MPYIKIIIIIIRCVCVCVCVCVCLFMCCSTNGSILTRFQRRRWVTLTSCPSLVTSNTSSSKLHMGPDFSRAGTLYIHIIHIHLYISICCIIFYLHFIGQFLSSNMSLCHFLCYVVRISNMTMETAGEVESEEGSEVTGGVARLIESCICPPGYMGLSCQVTINKTMWAWGSWFRTCLSLTCLSFWHVPRSDLSLSFLTCLSAGVCSRLFPSASVWVVISESEVDVCSSVCSMSVQQPQWELWHGDRRVSGNTLTQNTLIQHNTRKDMISHNNTL